MRKMALQKKMEEKEERARPRVEEMKREKGRAFYVNFAESSKRVF